MLKITEGYGLWRLAGQEESECAGYLSLDATGAARLRLIGGNWDFLQPQTTQGPNVPLIYGISEAGRHVTLADARLSRSRFRGAGYSEEEYLAQVVWEGDRWVDGADPLVTQVTIRLDKLHDWLGLNGLVRVIDNEDPTLLYNLQYRDPEPILTEIENAVWSFGCALDVSTKVPGRSVEIEQSNYLKIVVSEPVRFKDLLHSSIIPFRDFLSLVVSSPVSFEEIKIFEGAKRQPTSLYMNLTEPLAGRDTRRQNEEHFFKHGAIRDEFPDILCRWLKFASSHSRILALYSHTSAGLNIPIEFRLSTLIGLGDSLFASEGHRQHSWLTAIQAIVRELPAVLELIGEPTTFDEHIRQMRRKLARLTDYSLNGREMFLLSERLDVLIRINMLSQVGVSHTVLDRAIMTHMLTHRWLTGEP